MSEPIRSRLDELAQATREYAQYGYGGGWALFVGAASIVLGGVLGWMGVAPEWASVEAVLGTLAQLWALRLSRRWYQRRGAVVAAQGRSRGRGFRFLAYALVTCHVAGLAGAMQRPMPGPALLCAWIAAVIALPGLYGLTVSTIQGSPDALAVLMVLSAPFSRSMMSAPAEGGRDAFATFSRLLAALFTLFVAFVLAWLGATRHRAFRRLERRLEALRLPEPAPGPAGPEGSRP